MADFVGGPEAWVPMLVAMEDRGEKPSRLIDRDIALALGWRVSQDPWWNWHPGPRFDPPGDEWCVRRDGRNDRPCNEALPNFTSNLLRQELAAK